MDVIAKLEGTAIPIVLEPTMNAFTPLLEENRAKIESIERKTYKYGSTERHQLDVYYPPSTTTSSKPPILIFHYGGGLYSGDRVFPPPHDLVYRNLGAFFASRGLLTVIPDYRIVPVATFPDASQDSADAIKWVVENLAQQGEMERLVVMGHSIGAAIVSTTLLHEPALLDSSIKQKIKGAILCGGAHHFNGPPAAPPDVIAHYYGPKEQLDTRVPIALLRRASPDTLSNIPKLLIVLSENDAELMHIAHADFTKLARERLGEDKVATDVARNHNHISLNWALSTGEGEEWGEDVVKWIKAVAG